MFQRILAATDPVDGSDSVLQTAHDRARWSTCVRHSLALPLRWFDETIILDSNLRAEVEHTRDELRERAVRAGCSKGEFEVHVFDRVLGEEIPRAARRLDCNLIVIAARGTSKSGRFGIGSQAERILNCAPVPVLVMPPVPTPASATR